ncbi:SCO family protein [Ideonella sp. DXS22W]|uniref:SCO family protein n=1 Tax=Pseudaquabacterium inlustre TaxID=2984192 RepID=A0ABU9CP99_9BURK
MPLRFAALIAHAAVALALACGLGPATAQPQPRAVPAESPASLLKLNLPDVVVTDHRGQTRRFASELLRDRPVLVNFIFTSCTTVCSPMTAILKSARERLAASGRGDLQLVSITVDPLADTPERLRSYASARGAAEGDWHFVTGSRASIDAILAAFGLPTGGRLDDHTPMVFVGQGQPQRWQRVYGLAGPSAIVAAVQGGGAALPQAARLTVTAPPAAETPAGTEAAALQGWQGLRDAAARQAEGAAPARLAGRDAASHFTNLPLLTHDRGPVRFYDDLIRGRVVLVHAFFASCKDVCSPVGANLARAQQALAAAPGIGPVQLLSISVDPVADTPELLDAYANRLGARAGWSFVTGKKENVDWVLHKLGLYVPDKTQHQAALWIGNDRTNTWLKLHALAPPEAIVAAVRRVL